MTDIEKLRGKLNMSGYKLSYVADFLSLTYQGLLNKINGNSEFKTSEVKAISDLLGLSPEERDTIFFN